MITLKTLLDQLQDTYSCRTKNEYDTEHFVSRIDVLQLDTVLCGNTLYLGSDEVLGKFLKNRIAQAVFFENDTALGENAVSAQAQIPVFLIDANSETGKRTTSDMKGKNESSNHSTSDIKEKNKSSNHSTSDIKGKNKSSNHSTSDIKEKNESSNHGTSDINTSKNLVSDNNFSVILVENMPNITETFRFLNDRLDFEFRLQQELNDLYHLLYSGRGLDDLILRAESFLHRPMSVLDASYSMIAVSPLMHKLPFGLEKSAEGIFLSSQEVESLRRLQIEHQIYKNNQAFFIQTEDHPDTNWIFCGIRIQHIMTGYVALCLPDQAEASEHELRLITAFSDICAIEMQKHEFFVQKTGLQYETFLTELLEGRFNDVNIIEARLRLLNRRFGKFFCLAILYCPEPHNSDLFNKRQMASLRQVYPNAMSVVYKNNIILLINQDTPVQLNAKLTDPLELFAERNHLKASLSQPFADILKIRIFYNQALHTLELSDLQKPEQNLFYSTDALPEYLFSKCDYQGLEVGIHYHIFQLQDYDKMYHTNFVETLRAYLEHDRNAAKTAEFLHIHRSTFFYRVKKIEEVLEISISDSHLLFLYELSFKIWDYLCR